MKVLDHGSVEPDRVPCTSGTAMSLADWLPEAVHSHRYPIGAMALAAIVVLVAMAAAVDSEADATFDTVRKLPRRFYDPEYGIVCYAWSSRAIGCAAVHPAVIP
jgi:hypothetical protein